MAKNKRTPLKTFHSELKVAHNVAGDIKQQPNASGNSGNKEFCSLFNREPLSRGGKAMCPYFLNEIWSCFNR